MNKLQHDHDAANSSENPEPEATVADYLREHPALVLTMLDMAERYAPAPESDLDGTA